MKKPEIFKTNPNLKEVHMTSDGQAFYNDNDAKMHAKSLEDKKVELVLNPDHIEVVAEEVEETEETEETKATLEVVTEETASTEVEETSTEVQTASTEDETASTEVESSKDAEAPKVNLSRMDKAQLIAFAKENTLELDETLTNPKMVEVLTKQLEARK
jgi:hypothetical protein